MTRLKYFRVAAAGLLVIALAACSSSPPALPSPSVVPTTAPTVGAIDHRTGATDVVLRLDMSGGFAPMEALASSAPTFTLYGNGIVVFRPKVTTPPGPDPSGLVHNIAWRAARLDPSRSDRAVQPRADRHRAG